MATAPQQSVPSSPQVSQPEFLTDASGVPISASNPLPTSASVSLTNDGTFAKESGGNLASIKSDADTLVTNTTGLATHTDATTINTTLGTLATQSTLAAAKSDLDTIVTNTNKIPASPAQEGGNLATIATNTTGVATAANQTTGNTSLSTLAGIVSSNKAAVKAAASDIADLTHGQGTMANSVPVVIASNQTPLTAGTGTKTNVASSASSVTVLASNSSRKGALFYNDSTQVLYLDLSGGTASNTSYSVQVPSQGFFELPGPVIYTGAITGIWASANGNARVTEFS